MHHTATGKLIIVLTVSFGHLIFMFLAIMERICMRICCMPMMLKCAVHILVSVGVKLLNKIETMGF